MDPKEFLTSYLNDFSNLVKPNKDIIQKLVDGIITLSEMEIILSMKMVFERMKIVIEPSSSIVLAAALKNKKEFSGKNVGLIFSGGNIDCDDLPW